MYLIKPNGELGYSTIESSNMADCKRAEGFRVVNELEYTLARLVTRHNCRSLIRIVEQ